MGIRATTIIAGLGGVLTSPISIIGGGAGMAVSKQGKAFHSASRAAFGGGLVAPAAAGYLAYSDPKAFKELTEQGQSSLPKK